ncbi:MAG: pyruvate, water dikinase regulatory protein [Gammaproteobacteria bacterium]|nr:pyruvate, water dikinase regulatory protein [Gammaproteobacteria bacterium]
MQKRPVFIVSDRTGITAETLGHSLLTQFPKISFETTILPFVDTEEKIFSAVLQIDRAAEVYGVRPLVFTTFASPEHNNRLFAANGIFFDLFDTFLDRLEKELGQESAHSAGMSHGIRDHDSYTARISAVNFSVHCDDGLHPEAYSQAELILMGVSRSGKTPTSLYMAMHFGLFCANYPLTEEDLEAGVMPKAMKPHRDRIFGLTIDPVRLQVIRQERRSRGQYADLKQCRFEVRQAEAVFHDGKVPYVDTSAASIEEIATTIIAQKQLRRGYR